MILTLREKPHPTEKLLCFIVQIPAWHYKRRLTGMTLVMPFFFFLDTDHLTSFEQNSSEVLTKETRTGFGRVTICFQLPF